MRLGGFACDNVPCLLLVRLLEDLGHLTCRATSADCISRVAISTREQRRLLLQMDGWGWRVPDCSWYIATLFPGAVRFWGTVFCITIGVAHLVMVSLLPMVLLPSE